MKKQLDRIENKLDMLLNLVEDKEQSDNVGIEIGKLSDLPDEIKKRLNANNTRN